MATRTKKSGQRKALVVGLAAFASVCLIATGFAAWVISAKAEEKKTGNVNIGTVSSADVKIQVNQDTNNDGVLEGVTFSFNPKEEDKTGRVRNDGTNFESMKADISGTVGPQRFVTSFKIRLDIGKQVEQGGKTVWQADAKANQYFKDAQTAKYITLPDCFDKDVDLMNVEGEYTKGSEGDNAVAAFKHTLEFTWGEVFNFQNPGIFYDSDTTKEDDGKNASDAKVSETLNAFANTLAGNKDASKPLTEDQNYTFLITLTAETDQKSTTESGK